MIQQLKRRIQSILLTIDIRHYITEKEDLNPLDARRVELYKKKLEKNLSLPKEEYVDYRNKLTASSQAWLKYKHNGDWKSYVPYFKDLLASFKKLQSYRNEEGSLYDRLLTEHQEGWNKKRYDDFFFALKKELLPLLKEIQKRPQIDNSFLHQSYPADVQRKYMQSLLDYIGYTSDWGKISESEHPLTSWLSANDIRFTTKYREKDISAAIFSTIHESGHAYYTHQVDEAYHDTIIATSMEAAAQESQSRLCENHLGRNYAFWEAQFPVLKDYFPNQLGDISLDEFYRAIHKVEASAIRIEADEITYPFHIMIRYEIEKMIFDGEVEIEQLDELWKEKYKEYLGIDIHNAAEGILQDMHWPYAYFGYFPTYALGSAFASQIYSCLEKEIDVEEALRNHQYPKVMNWLKQNVHGYGNMISMDEVIRRISGESFQVSYYISYLKEKYSKIYGLGAF